jgi:hypothetical protein
LVGLFGDLGTDTVSIGTFDDTSVEDTDINCKMDVCFLVFTPLAHPCVSGLALEGFMLKSAPPAVLLLVEPERAVLR